MDHKQMVSKFHDVLMGDSSAEENKESKKESTKMNDEMEIKKEFKSNMPTRKNMPQGKGGKNYGSGAIAFAKLRLSKGK